MPRAEEGLLVLGYSVEAEGAPKLFDCAALRVGEVAIVVAKVVIFLEVDKKLPGLDQIFVDVVEVGKHYLSPTIEMVECFVAFCHFRVCLIEVAY